jgi:hypothetical protein
MLGLIDCADNERIEADYARSTYDGTAECVSTLQADFRGAEITRALVAHLKRLQVHVMIRRLEYEDDDVKWLRSAMSEGWDETYKLFLFYTANDETKEMIGVPMCAIPLLKLPASGLKLLQNVCTQDWILYSR